jgi:predicted metal-binding membrane protein
VPLGIVQRGLDAVGARLHFQQGPVSVLLFVAGWTVMTVAMMLPTSVPLK